MKMIYKGKMLGLLFAMLLLLSLILSFTFNYGFMVYAHADDENSKLEEKSNFGSDYLTIYNEDGTMEDINTPLVSKNTNYETNYRNSVTSVPSFNRRTLVYSGRPDNESIVITIMGDGFTSNQQNDFITAAEGIVNSILGNPLTGEQGIYPYNLFRDVFTVYAIEVISNESGVSRDYKKEEGNSTILVDNYFGSTYYYDGKTD